MDLRSTSRKRAVNHEFGRVSTLHLPSVAPRGVVLESRAHSTDAVWCVNCSCCPPWQPCFWSHKLGQCQRCVRHLPCICCQEVVEPSVLVPHHCLLLQDVFTCFSPVITITQPAHQAQRQDEPSSCLGKRICSRQVVCCSICCFVIQLLEQRKERDGYKNGQCQLLFIPCHLDNLPAVWLYSQLFTALSVALFPLLIYSFLWRGQPHFSAE